MWATLETYSGAVIAFFTVALVGVTVVYVFVTCRLLKQSKDALLADIVLRITGTCRRELAGAKKGEQIGVVIFMRAWVESYFKTFMEIDKKLGKNIEKLCTVCLNTMLNEWEEGKKLSKEWGKEEEKLKENNG